MPPLIMTPEQDGRRHRPESARHDYETPPDLYRRLSERFGPCDLDVCCVPATAKCERYFTPKENGLAQSWAGNVFCNPPYGSAVPDWLRKGRDEIKAGRCRKAIFLLPASTDLGWWHDYCLSWPVVAHVWLRGRVGFLRDGVPMQGNTMNSVAVIMAWPAARAGIQSRLIEQVSMPARGRAKGRVML